MSNSGLTCREIHMLYCLAKGLSAKQVAHKFNISEQAVKNRTKKIRDKLGVETTMAAVVDAIKKRYISVDLVDMNHTEGAVI